MTMYRFRVLFVSLICLCQLVVTGVDAQTSATGPHIEVELVSENRQLTPGQNWLAVVLKPEPQWHTYWRNPGDSGEPPAIDWILPEGVEAGDIQWPLPQKIPVAHLVNYGYSGDSVLMVPIQVSDSYFANHASVPISADLSWLVCKEDCIPGWATLSMELPLSTQAEPSNAKNLFNATREKLPQPDILEGKHEVTEEHIVVSVQPPYQSDWQVMPFDSAIVQHNQPQQLIQNKAGITLVANRSDYFSAAEQPLDFLLTDGNTGYYLTSQLNPGSGARLISGSAQINSLPLLFTMLMAFAGGLILNLMPCVLPVLSIKALSVQQQGQTSWVKLGYALGVLVSFNLFALAIVLLKQSGDAVGWGFHMQSPMVVGGLAFLFVYIALTLMDVAPSGHRFAGVGQRFIQGDGFVSQFATGVLAVIVASPCTAPFMAAALGVALVSEPIVTFILFTSLAIGFALPLSLLFWIPALTRRIPKPGMWMVTFRQFLAFPMLATVIWLVWVFQNQTSQLMLLWILTGLLIFAMAIWISSKVTTKVSSSFSLLLAVAALVVPLYFAETVGTKSVLTKDAFSVEKLDALRNANQVVLVNMTADWCITCKVNEQVAFSSEIFNSAIADENIHYLVGDWTNKNDEILKYLNQYQRSGVPLYVVYAGNQSYAVLPQILTTDIVIEALEKASGEIKNES